MTWPSGTTCCAPSATSSDRHRDRCVVSRSSQLWGGPQPGLGPSMGYQPHHRSSTARGDTLALSRLCYSVCEAGVTKRLWRRLAPAPGRHIRADRAPDRKKRSVVAICRAHHGDDAPGAGNPRRGRPNSAAFEGPPGAAAVIAVGESAVEVVVSGTAGGGSPQGRLQPPIPALYAISVSDLGHRAPVGSIAAAATTVKGITSSRGFECNRHHDIGRRHRRPSSPRPPHRRRMIRSISTEAESRWDRSCRARC